MEANEVYAILKNLIKKNSGATDEQIKQAVEEYLIKNPVSVETDKTLSKNGVPADSKATGDAIKKAEERVNSTIDERILDAFFGSMRNGKVYQTELYLTETNPTSDGVKTIANKDKVCEPSTDTLEGQDDYEGIGIFNWYNCNYITDDYGRKSQQQLKAGVMDTKTTALLT